MKFSLFLFCTLLSNYVLCQYKNDGLLYKTIYLDHLCDSLSKYPDKIILDVRSTEEYNDITMKGISGMNLGRLNNSININLNELPKRIDELEQYKHKAVFVICSHSQRSRRASTFLANNGFTNVFNINGGMTSLRQIAGNDSLCPGNAILTNTNYRLMSPLALCSAISHDKQLYIVDVRPDEDYLGNTRSAMNKSIGMLTNSHHIAIEDIAVRFSEIPVNAHIILTDQYGGDAETAANLLLNKGYTNVAVLAGGIEQFVVSDKRFVPCRENLLTSQVPYQIIGAPDLNYIYPSLKDAIFLDIRTADEFNNKHKDPNKNIGRFLNAVNIPYSQFPSQINTLLIYKNNPIIIYGFSTDPNCFEAATLLAQQGFNNIYVLARGIFNARWTSHNMENYDNLSKMIINVPEANL